jgi:hypothetical protein
MNNYFIKLINNLKLMSKINSTSIVNQNFEKQCSKCRYFSKNSGICTIFNRQFTEARKNNLLCGIDAEFYKEIKFNPYSINYSNK